MQIKQKTGNLLMKIALIFMAGYFVSCDRSREDKGYEYFPDMAHGYDYKTYEENEIWEDGQTMRVPAEGTVPTHLVPYPYGKEDPEERVQAGIEFVNPLIIDARVISEGEKYYNIFCVHCHGTQGEGDGYLRTSGKYGVPPRNLKEQRLVDQPSGETYHVISAGWGVMGEHASLITPERRWQIVSFIEKNIQNRQ